MIYKRCIPLLSITILISSFLYGQCGKVVKVTDGDTFFMSLTNNTKIKVRVAYVDCPELLQEFGQEAKNFTTSKILNQIVCVTVYYQDPYKRHVSLVKLKDGLSLNEQLLKNGLAWHFKKFNKDLKYANLEAEAKKKKSGLWKSSDQLPPWEWRKIQHKSYKRKKLK